MSDVLNSLPPITIDFGGLTMPDPASAPNNVYDRIRGDGTMPPGTPPEVRQMLTDTGGDGAAELPQVYSETDATQLRQAPDPADPVAVPPVTPAPAAVPPLATRFGGVRKPPVKPVTFAMNPEHAKRLAGRYDPTFFDTLADRLNPSLAGLLGINGGWGRMTAQESLDEQARRGDAVGQARKDIAAQILYQGSQALDGPVPQPTANPAILDANVAASAPVRQAEKLAGQAKPELKPWRNIAELGLQSFVNGVVALPRGAAIGLDALRSVGATIRGNYSNLDQNAVAAALEQVAHDVQRALPGDPGRAQEFASQLSQGTGSMFSFLVGGAVAKSLGLSAKVGTALTGAAVGGTQGYDDTMAHGAPVPARYLSFLINAGLGATEAIPIDRAFSRLNQASGGWVARALGSMTANALEEATQEIVQQIGSNLTAKVLYDNARGIFDGVADAGLVAGVIGGLFGLGTQSVHALTLKAGQKQAASGQPAPVVGRQEPPASGSQPTGTAPARQGTLTGAAGSYAGTPVEITGETPDGSGYTVKLPDGSQVDTPKASVEEAPQQDSTTQAVAPAPVQTDTPEFRNWFGDSKVVDANGKPLVVYHGSPDARDLLAGTKTFATLKERYGQQDGERAFFFASDRSTASTYADPRRAFDYQGAEPAIVPVYLSLRNPLVVDNGGKRYDGPQKQGDLLARAKAAGYDGVVIRNTVDSYAATGKRLTDVYVAFDPTQIKSATGNSGAFDPNNPDITASVAPEAPQVEPGQPEALAGFTVFHGSPHNFDKFDISKNGEPVQSDVSAMAAPDAGPGFTVYVSLPPAADQTVSAMRTPERMRGVYPAERQRPAKGIVETTAKAEPSASKREITDRFKDAIDLVVKQGRFGRGNSKAEAIYKWGQSVARVRSEGQMLELFHEGGHHLHSQLKPLLDAVIGQHNAEITHIADTMYGGGKVLDLKDKELVRREGFATFFQIYMNNPAEARVIAPGFLPAFERLMETNSPGIMGEMQAIRRDVDAWLTAKSSAQLARERVVSNKPLGVLAKIVESVNGGTLLHDVATLANRVYQATLNDQHPLTLAARRLKVIAEENIRTQIERGLLNRKQAEQELANLDRRGRANPVKMANLARHAYAASSEMLATGVARYQMMTDADAAPMSKGLPEILAMITGGRRLDLKVYADFNTYLAMRRVVSEWKNYQDTVAWDRAVNLGAKNVKEPPVKRFRRPDDVSMGDAQQAVADLEKANPAFARAAPEIYQFLDALLQYKVDAGLMTQAQADAQRQIADYVPLRREMDDKPSGLGKGKDARTGKDNLIRVFRGSDRRILSPIESLMQMTHETAALVARNDVKRALVDMALDVGQGSGAVVEQIPATATKGTSVRLADVLKAAGDFSLAEDIAQAMGRDDITLQEFLDEVLDGDEVGTIWRKADVNEKGDPIVYVWRDGTMEAYQLNDHEWADQLYSVLTELGKEQSNLLINILGKPAAMLRAGVTTAPPFLIANIVRDQVSAWILNDGVYPGAALGKGLASDLWDRKTRRLYNLSMSSIAGSNLAALDKVKFGTEQSQLAKAGVVVASAEKGLSDIARISGASETWSRQGIWRAAFDKAKADGLSVSDAMIEAGHEATDYANYSRAGSRMLMARRLITFLNANLQGLDKSQRVLLAGESGQAALRKAVAPWLRRQLTPAMAARLGLEGSKTSLPLTSQERAEIARAGRTWAKMASLALASALLAMLYWDDEEYDTFSPYMRGTRWMVKLGPGKWLAVPKPFQLASLATFVEYAIDSAFKGDPTAMQNFMKSQAAVIAPPYETPLVKLFYELETNTDTFSGRQIVPDAVAARPAWLQYDEYTSELGKIIGKFTGASPMVVDHVITGSFATWGRGFLTASNLLNPDRPQQGLDDMAFTSYFIKNGARSTTIRPAFLDLVGQKQGALVGAYSGYKELMDGGAEGQARAVLRELTPDQQAFALLYYHQDSDAKKLHPLRNAYDVVQVISGMRKEIILNRLKTGGKDDGAPIVLSPSQQKLVNDRLSDLQIRLQRNALVATGQPGFAQRKVLPTLTIIRQIEAIDPRVADDLKARLGTRVYTADIVASLWPAVKAELLNKGPEANLRSFVFKAKAAGTKIWTMGALQ